jgi:hypothetical protein
VCSDRGLHKPPLFVDPVTFPEPAKRGQGWNHQSRIAPAERIGNRAFTARQLGLHELDIESESDFVTNQNAPGLKGGVPGQAEVFSVDLCGRGDRNPSVAPGILRRRCGPFDRKADLAGNATDGQVAFDPLVSVAVDRLYKKGFVSRVECSEDRRVRTVSLTEKGRQMFVPLFRRHTALIKRAFQDVSSEEMKQLEVVLKKISKRAESLVKKKGHSQLG